MSVLSSGQHERRTRDPGEIRAYVGARDCRHESDLARHRRAPHELDPPFDAFSWKFAAEPRTHGTARPVLHTVLLEFLDQRLSGLGFFGAIRYRGADDRERLHPLRMACGECSGDGAPDL